MANDIWDDDDLFADSEFVTFDKVGDSVSGVVTAIGRKTFPAKEDEPESIVPQITLDTDDGERVLTAGQTQLKKKLRQERPAVGDGLTVTYTGKQGRMKTFSVEVKKASDKPGF